MKKYLAVILFSVSACTSMPERGPSSKVDISAILKKYGNFFEPVTVKSVTDLKMEIPIAKKLGIKSTIYKKTLDQPLFDLNTMINASSWSIEMPSRSGNYDDPSVEYVIHMLEPTFEAMTLAQFEALKKHFKSETSFTYDKSRKYTLVDFLPPAVQALYGNYYVSNRYTHSDKDLPWVRQFVDTPTATQISRITNCWNAAWEYQRNSKSDVSIFFADEISIKNIFEDNTYSREVLRADGATLYKAFTKPEEIFDKLQPGDVMMFYQIFSGAMGEVESLAHISTVVDKGIVFEKTNPGSNFPYRLGFFRDSVENLIVSNKEDSHLATTKDDLKTVRLVVRRFSKPLPHVSSLINMRLAPGMFIDVTTLPAKEQPSEAFQTSHTVISELGTGGTIINENLYKIEDQKIQRDSKSGRYVIIPSVQDL